MADKRMFSKAITDNDNFISLSASAQALYFHIAMASDDDGFCSQLTLAMFKAHASAADLEQLIDKKYLIQFPDGVVVVKHWKLMNTIRSDRYIPTKYQEHLADLSIDNNKSYTNQPKVVVTTNWQPFGNQVTTNGCQMVATDKVRLDKDRLDSDHHHLSNPLERDRGTDDDDGNGRRSIVNLLNDEEVDLLFEVIPDLSDVEAVLDRVDTAKLTTTITKPLPYILSVARSMGVLKIHGG